MGSGDGDQQPESAGDSTIDPYTTRFSDAENSAIDCPTTVPFGVGPTQDVSAKRATREPGAGAVAEQRYRILRPIAQGGLGQVLLAQDEVLGREVAIKYIRPGLVQNRDMVDRFLVEASITGNLEHPGIVGVYALGRDQSGQPFYVMKLIRGESLKESIRSYYATVAQEGSAERLRGLRKLLNRLISACNAIAFAHSRGVLHRDIKPANIMIGKYGETLVVDWGLAKRLYKYVAGSEPGLREVVTEDNAEITQSGVVVGTPAYMSPEQALGRQDLMEPTSDVYSLGATLFEILTGQTRFPGMRTDQVIKAACEGKFSSPKAVNSEVDSALDAVCRKAMALDPEDRYATARAFADDLERWLGDEPVVAFREPVSRALVRWLTRNPKVLIVGLIGVVVLLVLALVTTALVLVIRGAG